MLPSTIRTALDVKNAVESAPHKLQAIGKCVTAVDDFNAEHVAEEDADMYASAEEEGGEEGGLTNKVSGTCQDTNIVSTNTPCT